MYYVCMLHLCTFIRFWQRKVQNSQKKTRRAAHRPVGHGASSYKFPKATYEVEFPINKHSTHQLYARARRHRQQVYKTIYTSTI